MSPETAQQVVIGITLVGAVVWLMSLSFLAQSARQPRAAYQGEIVEPSARHVLAGTAEVEGPAKILLAKAASTLAKGALGPLKIVTTNEHILFERLDPGVANQPPGRWFRRGEMRFTALGQNRTQILRSPVRSRLCPLATARRQFTKK